MPKATAPPKPRHNPLHSELKEDAHLAQFGRLSKKKKARRSDDEEETGAESARMSRKILDLAGEQREELEREARGESEEDEAGPSMRPAPVDSDDSDDDLPPGALGSDESDVEEYEDFEIDPEDHATLDRLRGSSGTGLPTSLMSLSREAGPEDEELDEEAPGKTLADVIFEKIREAEEGKSGVLEDLRRREARGDDGPPDPRVGLPAKVVEVYTKVGYLLSRYKSGPLPRALKILPSLPHWAQLLALTAPPKWTSQATLACTRIFVSNLKPDQVKVYLQGVLLEKVRDDLVETQRGKKAGGGKLDVHLYDSLKKGLYKPAAFFKGILFPLCEEGCTLSEATIVASVLAKVSVPVLHSAAALLRLASMDYTGPNSLFIRVLLDKKYALPYKVVDALVFHYIRLANSPRSKDGEDKLPVLWHQSLLVFVQRYGSDLTPDQKDALLDVIRARPHHKISPEIRRELVASVVRGEPRPEEAGEEDVEMR